MSCPAYWVAGSFMLALVTGCGGAGEGVGPIAPVDAGTAVLGFDAAEAPPDAAPRPAPDAQLAADASEPADAGLVAVDAGLAPDADPLDVGPTVDAGSQSIGELCFGEIFDPAANAPSYDQFGPTMAQHCYGTNHQDISGIERVVFLGDSVTVGTPPTESSEYYRSVLADRLAQQFGLEAPSSLWKRPNLIDGVSMLQSSGDFASCAKWGARADDLIQDNSQIMDCFPESERNKRTLVIMTMGGNDIASITKRGAEGLPVPEVWLMAEETARLLREAIQWFREDPNRFPNGVFVIFANPFEFTDGTGDVSACPAASVAGFDEPWDDPQALEDIVIWLNEQYMDIAVSTQTDMIMMLEHFCGHGYRNDDPTTRCYRGPGAERWFDLSCIHPNPRGHEVIADMFMAVVNE